MIKILQDYIESKNKPRKKTSHHISGLLNCTRQQYYQWMDVPKSNPPNYMNIIKWEFGYAFEEIFYKACIHACEQGTIDAFSYQDRIEIKTAGKTIAGYLDFVIYKNNEIILCDTKSSFGRKTTQVKNGEVPDDYLLQLHLYSKYYGVKIDKCTLLYGSRDTGYCFEVSYKKDYFKSDEFMEIIKKAHKNLKIIETALENDEIPERQYVAAYSSGVIVPKFTFKKEDYKSDWQCRYCDYHDKCWRPEFDGKYYNGELITV